VREEGAAIIGQTADLAPADKRLYAIRDVTATVESIPLITASILSKKLAAGLSYLVLDAKAGSGAFMKTAAEASLLAGSIVAVANGAGLRTTALITDMDEPLAPHAGNAIEVGHACRFLAGTVAESRVMEVTLALGAELLMAAGLASSTDGARAMLSRTLATGAAAERFDRMVRALGGPTNFVMDHERHLAPAPLVRPVYAERNGTVSAIRTSDLGLAVIELGGGRKLASDRVDHRVGLSNLLGKGAIADRQTPLCLVHAADDGSLDKAAAIVKSAYVIGEAPALAPLIIARIGS
jgi:thymidine phosphorylase